MAPQSGEAEAMMTDKSHIVREISGLQRVTTTLVNRLCTAGMEELKEENLDELYIPIRLDIYIYIFLKRAIP